jgi:hypothetical protein
VEEDRFDKAFEDSAAEALRGAIRNTNFEENERSIPATAGMTY